MRRLLSFILFLCFTIGVMAQSDYGLTVAGTPVTSANKSDILGDGKVSYDPASHTLRLKNANIETGTAAVFTEDRLIIDLDGTNSFIAARGVESIYNPTSATDYGVTICSTTGNGTLTTEGYESAISVGNSGGIYIHDCSITAKHSMSAISGYISGNNTTLKIEHANIDIQGQSTEACIAGFENLVLEKCEIVEPSNAYYKSAWGYGAMRQGDDDTKCISLKIKAKDATDYGISASALNGTTYSVNSENFADVMGDGTISYDVEQNTLTINGAHLFGFAVMDFCKPGLRINIVGKETTVDEYFILNTSCTLVGNNTKKAITSQLNVNSISLASSLTIQDLAVEFIGNKQGFQSLSGTASLTLKNATVNANGAAGVFKYIPSLVLEDCEILTPEGAYYDAEKKYIVDESGNRVTGVVTIGQKPVVEYGIRIDDETVTEENCADVLGNGTISYDAAKNALRLNNAKIKNIVFESNCKSGVRMDVEGTANELETISFNVAGSISGSNSGSDVKSAIKIKNTTSYAIDMQKGGDVTIENVNLDIDGAVCVGNGNNVLTLRNATVSVVNNTSGTQLFKDIANIVFEDCYRYSPTESYFDAEQKTYLERDISKEEKGKPLTKHILIVPGQSLYGNGTFENPYIIEESNMGTFLAPVGDTVYRFFPPANKCVFSYSTELVDESVKVSLGDYFMGSENRKRSNRWLYPGGLTQGVYLFIDHNPSIENKVTISLSEPAEGESTEKAIPLKNGDKFTIPEIGSNASLPIYYKVTLPAKHTVYVKHRLPGQSCNFSLRVEGRGEVGVAGRYIASYYNNSDEPQEVFCVSTSHPEFQDATVQITEGLYDIFFYNVNDYTEIHCTGDNYTDILGDGTASYDPTTKVLTLNNVNMKDYALYFDTQYKGYREMFDGFKIKLVGNNVLHSMVEWDIPWTLYGEGNLTLYPETGNGFSSCKVTIEDCNVEIINAKYSGFEKGCSVTIRNANVKITSSIEYVCVKAYKFELEGCRIVSPEGAYFDKDKETVVDKDGNPVTGELIILKDTPQFSGSGTKDDPYILGEGTNTFTTPVGETYYKYTATKDCVMQIEVDEQSGVTGDILFEGFEWYKDGDIENREILLHDGSNVMLRIVSTDPDNKVTVKIRDVADGEIWYKAIPLKEGDNPLPTIVWQKQLVMWYKLLVPKGKYMIATFTKDVQFHFSENDAENATYGMVSNSIDTHNSTANEDYVIFVRVSSMPEGGNANVKYEDAVEPVYGYDLMLYDEVTYVTTWLDSKNSTDVFEDGTVSYDFDANVLTLNNAVKNNLRILPDVEGLMSKPFTMKLVGDNSFKLFVVQRKLNCNICGDGKLSLSGNCGVMGGDLLIEDCQLDIDGGRILLPEDGVLGKLTIRNATVRINSENSCIDEISDLVLEGCTILKPFGAYFDPAQHAVVDKDGNPVTGELIIGKPTTPEKGTGTKEDPFVLDDTLDKLLGGGGTGGTGGGTGGGGTGTGTGIDGTGTGKYPNPPVVVTPPAGANSYYSYTAKEDCVLGMAVSGECESSAVTINGNSAGSIENREILLRKGNVAVLNFVNPATGYKVAINLREPGEGEIWYKAIALNKGDNAVPAVNEAKNVALWYKATVPAGQTMTLSLDVQGKGIAFAADNADAESDGKAVESDGSGMIYSYVNTTSTAIDLCVKFEDMKAGCNANVKFEVPFIPEEGTGSKEDPFKLDDTLDKLLGGGGSGGSGGGGTGGGSGTGGTGGGTGTGTGIDGTGTGKYPTPPVVITPPAGTDSYYSYTAKTDCVLGIAVKAGNVFEGKLTINGKDAGNIEEREILLLAGDAALLYVKNAEEGDKLLINLRPVDEGEIWYKPIELVEGDNDIPVVVEGKNLDLWYKVRVASDKAMILNTNVKGTMLAFAAKDAEKQERPVALKNTETGMTYTVANTSAEDLEVCFMVKSMPAACVANVAFDSASEHPDKEAPTLDNTAITVDDVTETTISLSWTAATDDRTPQEVLEYIVECTDVATGTKTEHAVGSDTQYVLTDLMSGNAYLLNVMVRDEAGNSAYYEPIEVNTISGIGSVTLDPSASGVRKYIDKHRVRISRGNSIYDANGRVVK